MIHPLIARLASQPGLLAEHACAYAALAGAEAGMLGQRWLRRGVLLGVSVATGALALGLAGMAALLTAALPVQAMPAPWALVVVPVLPGVVSALCAWLARGSPADPVFPLLRQQIEQDTRLLSEVDAA